MANRWGALVDVSSSKGPYISWNSVPTRSGCRFKVMWLKKDRVSPSISTGMAFQTRRNPGRHIRTYVWLTMFAALKARPGKVIEPSYGSCSWTIPGEDSIDEAGALSRRVDQNANIRNHNPLGDFVWRFEFSLLVMISVFWTTVALSTSQLKSLRSTPKIWPWHTQTIWVLLSLTLR